MEPIVKLSNLIILVGTLVLFQFSGKVFACEGEMTETQKQEFIAKLEQDLSYNELNESTVINSEVINQSVSVGSRGSCSAVTIQHFQKITYPLGDMICTAYAASELSQGYIFRDDYIKHILSVVNCREI